MNNHYIIQGKKGLPVIEDPVKMRQGIATGHIIVRPKVDADITNLAKKHKLKVEHVVPHLNLVTFVPENEDELLEVSILLSQSPLLESVKLDVSYGGPRAK